MLGAPHAPEQDRAEERRSMEMNGPASGRRLRMEDTAEELAERMTQHAARFRSNQQAFSEQAQYMQQPIEQYGQVDQHQQFAQQQQLLSQLAALSQSLNSNGQ